jgi:hypothetical protein
MNERNIIWEGSRYWVLRVPATRPFKGRAKAAHTQVFKIGATASESVETYPPGADGESIAIARAKYLEARAVEKYEEAMYAWRMEDPAKFIYRVCAYLSKYHPNPRKWLESLQSA